MAISDGQPVNAAVTNPAFISKNTDDQMPNKLDFINNDPISGPSVTNIQRNVNSLASFIGAAINGVYNLLPTWVTNNRGISTNNIFQRVSAIDTAFDPSTGHAHTGTAGDGPKISALNLSNIPLVGAGVQGVDLVAVTGTSTVVTSQFSGYQPSTSPTVLGVVVNAPYNKIILRNSVNDEQFEDAFGNIVYGRLTNATSVWTLSYYSEIAGTETAYTFASSGVRFYFQLLSPVISSTAPVYSELFFVPSSNATADVITATQTLQGKTQLASATPQSVGMSASVGTPNATVANADHVHTIGTNVVTNAELAQMPTLTIKGNNTGGTGNALDLTVAQVNAILSSGGGSSSNQSYILQNLGLATSVGSSAITVALKQSDGATDPASGSGVVTIGFRSATGSSGAYSLIGISSALSIVIPSGATLGQISAVNQYVWVYALNNAGTIELAVSGINVFKDSSVASTTAISGSSTSGSTLYSTTARTNVAIRLIGRLLVNEATAGTWASNATEIALAPEPVPNITEIVSYTPTIVGMGAATNVVGYSYRNGKTLKGTVYFTVASSTNVTAQVTYGFNGSNANVTLDNSSISGAVNTVIGNGTTNSAFAVQYVPIANSTFFNIGIQSASTGGLTPALGSSISGPSGTQFCFTYEVPILGWSVFGP